jgi:nicotinamide-nucleotide adenylyltransferase
MSSLLAQFRTALHTFASSSSSFEVLRSLPSAASHASPKKLIILDSSFNPPTLAHLHIASSALEDENDDRAPRRLLLLLATINADKPPKPAPFEHRLVMMTCLAQELLDSQKGRVGGMADLAIDVGMIKFPYFVDKSAAILHSGIYQSVASAKEAPIEQIHLVGFDTLTRLFDPKYYPPSHTLSPLRDLFRHHRIRATYRPDDGWGGKEEQDSYPVGIANGKLDDLGGRREWAERITMVRGPDTGDEAISSTRARQAAKEGDEKALRALCPKNVADWVLQEMLYREE